jgi:hypothetical protein
MKLTQLAATILALTFVCSAQAQNQKQQDLKGAEAVGQRDDMTNMTAAQQAQYKAQYEAAKSKWATMTPQERSATIATARNKKLSELSALELVGQRNDMQRETAAQTAQDKAQADAAKAKWASMTPDQKKAVRKAAWAKKRGELDAMEAVGQRDDDYVLPY